MRRDAARDGWHAQIYLGVSLDRTGMAAIRLAEQTDHHVASLLVMTGQVD